MLNIRNKGNILRRLTHQPERVNRMSEANGNTALAGRNNALVSRDSVHEAYLPDVLDRASKGLCDGACENHGYDVKAVRVFGADGHDWGYFSYCDKAVKEDISREMIIEYIDG